MAIARVHCYQAVMKHATRAANPIIRGYPADRSIPDISTYLARRTWIRKQLDEALQELLAHPAVWVWHESRSAVLNAPTTVAITVARGSRVATIPKTHWHPWMDGCTLVVAGSAVDNQIVNAGRVVTLKFPHDGASGVTTAVVYADAITSAADVAEVIEPVRLDRILQLTPIASLLAYVRRTMAHDIRFHRRSTPPPPLPVGRVAVTHGMPVAFLVENPMSCVAAPSGIRLRIFPAPAQQCVVDYQVRLRPSPLASPTRPGSRFPSSVPSL
jgi:hypothetical protein